MANAAIFVLVAVTAIVCLEVVMRYGFDQPQVWVVEIAEYALLYITFLGTAWTLRNNGHVRVDILVGMMGPGWRARIGVVTSLLGLGVSLVLVVFGAQATWTAFVRGAYKPTLVEFPTWLVLVVIPVGSLFLAIRFLRQAVAHARGRGEDTEPVEAGL